MITRHATGALLHAASSDRRPLRQRLNCFLQAPRTLADSRTLTRIGLSAVVRSRQVERPRVAPPAAKEGRCAESLPRIYDDLLRMIHVQNPRKHRAEERTRTADLLIASELFNGRSTARDVPPFCRFPAF